MVSLVQWLRANKISLNAKKYRNSNTLDATY